MASKAETLEALLSVVAQGRLAGVVLDNWPEGREDPAQFIVYVTPQESWSFTHKEAIAFLIGIDLTT